MGNHDCNIWNPQSAQIILWIFLFLILSPLSRNLFKSLYESHHKISQFNASTRFIWMGNLVSSSVRQPFSGVSICKIYILRWHVLNLPLLSFCLCWRRKIRQICMKYLSDYTSHDSIKFWIFLCKYWNLI